MVSCVSPLVAMELFLHEWVCFFVYHLQNHARVTPCAVLMVSQYFIDQPVVTRQVAPQCSRQKASREDWRIVNVDVMNAGFQNACKVRSAEAKKWTQHTLYDLKKTDFCIQENTTGQLQTLNPTMWVMWMNIPLFLSVLVLFLVV